MVWMTRVFDTLCIQFHYARRSFIYQVHIIEIEYKMQSINYDEVEGQAMP